MFQVSIISNPTSALKKISMKGTVITEWETETSKCKYPAPRKIIDMISYTTSKQTYILTLNNSTFYKSSKYKYSFINTNVLGAFLAF